jgi:tRNA-dihydrouridine synthase B
MKKSWDNPRENAMPAQVRVPAEVMIGSVRVAPATVLAPMAGVTDTVFRRFIRNASVFTRDSPIPSSQIQSFDDGFVVSSNEKFVVSSNDKFVVSSKDKFVVSSKDKFVVDSNDEFVVDSDDEFVVPPDFGENSIHLVDALISNQQSGCGLIMTEFTSADGLARMRESKRKRYLSYYEDEHPISAQLFGSDPQTLSEAAKIVEDAGFDIVDLNLGCPAKRVVSCNGGSGLLRDLPLIARIFESVRSAVRIPFTVKFRMGWNDQQIVCVDLARLAQESGLNAVALHARTREQGYSGQARWEYIAAVKDAVRIPVIGNGDIRSPEDACTMIDETGCDAVMIGRAAPANPWIFRQIAQYTAFGMYDQPSAIDRYRMIRTYFVMLMEEGNPNGNPEVTGKMKQFASWFTHGVPGGARLRKNIYEARKGEQILSAVDEFFQTAIRDQSSWNRGQSLVVSP